VSKESFQIFFVTRIRHDTHRATRHLTADILKTTIEDAMLNATHHNAVNIARRVQSARFHHKSGQFRRVNGDKNDTKSAPHLRSAHMFDVKINQIVLHCPRIDSANTWAISF
jgi:hypothetical protein